MLIPLAITAAALAKIGDPPGAYDHHRLFCGHGNVVSAYRAKNKDDQCGLPGKLLWKTELPFKMQPEHLDHGLEEDVQWCRVTGVYLYEGNLKAYDCHRNEYLLDPKTGKMKNPVPSKEETGRK
jgi:hypothetical protein